MQTKYRHVIRISWRMYLSYSTDVETLNDFHRIFIFKSVH